jgi:hypothetical protein
MNVGIEGESRLRWTAQEHKERKDEVKGWDLMTRLTDQLAQTVLFGHSALPNNVPPSIPYGVRSRVVTTHGCG